MVSLAVCGPMIAAKRPATITKDIAYALYFSFTNSAAANLKKACAAIYIPWNSEPTKNIVDYVKSKGVPVICFPKGIDDYKEYVSVIKPDVISIDYNVDPRYISENINITVQGGLNPKYLLGEKRDLEINVKKYLDIFKDKQYIFNLGHGVPPEADPDMVDHLVKLVKNRLWKKNTQK